MLFMTYYFGGGVLFIAILKFLASPDLLENYTQGVRKIAMRLLPPENADEFVSELDEILRQAPASPGGAHLFLMWVFVALCWPMYLVVVWYGSLEAD